MVNNMGFPRASRFVATLAVALLALSLNGCWHPDLPRTLDVVEESQLVGTWVHFEDGQPVSKITFSDGGAVEIDFPRADLVELFDASEFVDGTWEIRPKYDGQWAVLIIGKNDEGEILTKSLGRSTGLRAPCSSSLSGIQTRRAITSSSGRPRVN